MYGNSYRAIMQWGNNSTDIAVIGRPKKDQVSPKLLPPFSVYKHIKYDTGPRFIRM